MTITMSKIIHEIDPDADTVIILKETDFPFASWDVNDEKSDDLTVIEELAIGDVVVEAPPVDESSSGEPVLQNSAVTVPNDETSAQATSSGDLSVRPDLADDCTPNEEVHYYVSSRHLTLASTRFKHMLSEERWKEGVRDKIDGRYHVSAEGWDAEAFLLVLEVLHHHNRKVPRTISLEMLAKVAVLVDDYDCAEALESYTERWIENLRMISPIPSHFCRDLMLWMCIAWVFRLPQEFSRTTTVAIRRGVQELPTLGLPIALCTGESVDYAVAVGC